MPVLLPCLLLCYLSFSVFADDQHSRGTTADDLASWTEEGDGVHSLELLQKSSAKVSAELAQLKPSKASCRLPKNAVWCTARSGNKTWSMAVYGDYEDNFVSTKVCEVGFWEFQDLSAMGLPKTMNKEFVLLDIGANVGWYTFMFAAHGHKVIAVEPMTSNRKLMEATLCMNPDLAPRIHIFATALTSFADPGQKCGILSCPYNTGDGILACSDYERSSLGRANECYYTLREEVPLTSLDALLATNPHQFGDRIDMVKIDVEGQECNVVRGAQHFFSQFRPQYMMIETRLSDEDHHGKTFDCVVNDVSFHAPYSMRPGNFSAPSLTSAELHSHFNATIDVFFKL